MKKSTDPIAELQKQVGTPIRRGPSQRVRQIQHRLRLAWIGVFGLSTAALAYYSVVGPAAIRLEMGLLTAMSLLMLLFLVREEQNALAIKKSVRYLWHRLRDLSQIFEVSLGVRSQQDVRQLAGLGLQETLLLLQTELGAIALSDSGGEDHITVLGFEERDFDHRPWLIEVRGLMSDLEPGAMMVVPDLSADERFRESAAHLKAGFGSLAAFRFGDHEETEGLMVVGNSDATQFNGGDRKTFELAGRQMQALMRHGRKLDRLGEQIDDLRREVDELTYANQAKSEFASVASHELKTPLTAVKGSVDTLLAMVRAGDHDSMEEFLLLIREEADRLIQMTGKILEISSLDYSNRVMERRPVRLRRVVDSCAQAMEVHLQEKDMSLEVDVNLDLPQVFADPGMVRQVLINLLGNAVKFSSSGQSVRVSARQRGQAIEVMVLDRGSGIPEEEQPHIFDRFYQGSREGDNHIQSTGLGLAIVKEIVEQHQGQIRVESEPGSGARFIFDLPLARDGGVIEGSSLDLQPRGEVEEFLRLAVDWIGHMVRSDRVHLFLGGVEDLRHFHASESELDNRIAGETALQAMTFDTSVHSEDTSGEGGGSIGVPLRFRQGLAGCFVAFREGDDFSQEDLLLVEGIVDRIGRVLAEAASRRDPGRSLRRAMRAVRDLLQSGKRVMPTRVDPSLLAWELAERAGADKDLAQDVRLAINFHDVAMAQIGMEIEKEDRPLNSDEIDKLRDHPRQAAGLLEDIQAMEEVSRIVLHHHEWFNGQGYPDGLTGEEIPLGARIVAIIDAYCSMIAPRKYRPMHKPEAAARELVNFSDQQFDPRLIRHFVEMLREKSWIDASVAEALLQDHEIGDGSRESGDLIATVETIPADNQYEDGPA